MSSKSKWFKGPQKRGASNKAALEESKFFRDVNRELIKSLSDMEAENAKLRELMLKNLYITLSEREALRKYKCDEVYISILDEEISKAKAEMRELGMELDE